MLSDEDILERGGTQEDINAYAHDVGGACGATYGGKCDYCGKISDTPKRADLLEFLEASWINFDTAQEVMSKVDKLVEQEIAEVLDRLVEHTNLEAPDTEDQSWLFEFIEAERNQLRGETK